MKTLLQIVNAAQAELGLEESDTVFGPAIPDRTGAQMGALANRVIDEMRRMNPSGWSAMKMEYNLVVDVPLETTGDMAAGTAVITGIPDTSTLAAHYWAVSGDGIPQGARILSVDSATQVTMTMENTNTADVTAEDIVFSKDTYPLPSDFDFYINQTMWDRTNRWQMIGPDSAQRDQFQRSGVVATGPRRHFRQIGPYANTFRIWPPPSEITTPLQLVFEYSSISAVRVAGSATSFAQDFTADTDVPLLDDQAIIMGIKWMFWESKGFGSYVTLQNRWVDYVERQIARDAGAPKLNWNRQADPLYITSANVQDGYFPDRDGLDE